MTATLGMRHYPSVEALKRDEQDFNEVARQGAVYAARMAATEILTLRRPEFWFTALLVYHSGNWPFGFYPDGRLIVL
jgi:hypothetical protein